MQEGADTTMNDPEKPEKQQPWKKWLAEEMSPSSEAKEDQNQKPWIKWKPNPSDPSEKPWLHWDQKVKSHIPRGDDDDDDDSPKSEMLGPFPNVARVDFKLLCN